MSIEEFIAARLAEDEAAANAAGGDRWAYDTSKAFCAAGDGEVYRPDSTREYSYGNGHTGHEYSYVTCDSEGLTPAVELAEGVHIARHDPARVLRQVAGVRKLLALYSEHRINSPWEDDEIEVYGDRWIGADNVFSAMLTQIAAIWSDHPDFQPEWNTP